MKHRFPGVDVDFTVLSVPEDYKVRLGWGVAKAIVDQTKQHDFEVFLLLTKAQRRELAPLIIDQHDIDRFSKWASATFDGMVKAYHISYRGENGTWGSPLLWGFEYISDAIMFKLKYL